MLRTMFALLVLVISTMPGMAQLLPTDADTLNDDRLDYLRADGCKINLPVCGTVDPNAHNVLIIGDSFATDAYNVFVSAYPDINFIILPSNGCAPFDEGSAGKEKCPQENAERNAVLADLVDVKDIILTVSLLPDDGRRERLPDYVRQLSAMGHRVIMMGGAVRYKRPLPEIYARLASASQPFPDMSEFIDPSPTDLNPALEEVTAETGGVFIDRNAFICPDGTCRGYTLAKDALLYMDGRHSTLQTSRELGQYILENYPDLFAP